VTGTVDLDDELGSSTIEIRRVTLERMLPPELQPIGSPTQNLPEIGLRE
jgi:hypothetical protein